MLTVFGGSEVDVHGKISCKVLIDGVSLCIDLLVVAECIPGVDIVIGQNFTENHSIRYSRTGDKLLFSPLAVNSVNSEKLSSNQCSVKIGVANQEVQKKVLEIIENYSDCFPDEDTKLPSIKGFEMIIQLKSDKPVVQRPYRLAEAEKSELRKIIDELLRNETIRPSQSPFASPLS